MFKFVFFAIALIVFVGASDDDKNAEVKSAYSENDGNGHFKYGHDITNGVEAKAEGDGNVIHGEYYLIDENGDKVKVSYTADANGFHPVSSLLPTNIGSDEILED